MASSSTITNAGVGSGNDFESIISQSVAAKRQQITSRTTTKKAEVEIERDGVNSLKSALKTFEKVCEDMTKDNSMNTHKVTTTLPTDCKVFDLTCKEDCVNTNFDICVTQLASAESMKMSLKNKDSGGTFNNSFAAGSITIDLGKETYTDDKGVEQTRERTFTVDINEGDTIEMVRKRLNENDFDFTCNLITTKDGYSLSFTAGTTGKDTSQIQVSSTTTGEAGEGKDSLSLFNTTALATDADGKATDIDYGNWTHTEGKDCIIKVDGEEVSSHTNTFDKQISGISLTVNRLSETETTTDAEGKAVTGFKSYNVNIDSDYDACASKMQSFVNAFNTLMSSVDKLTKRNTYADGKNKYDGGDLAGDSQAKSIQSTLQNMIVRFNTENAEGKTIFDCGLKYEKDGTLSLDSTKFKDSLKKSFNSVTSMFTGENGLLDKLKEYTKDYTKSAGILDDRADNLKKTIDSWTAKEEKNEKYLEDYENSLRKKYGNLDSLLSGYNTSMSYVSSILSGTM